MKKMIIICFILLLTSCSNNDIIFDDDTLTDTEVISEDNDLMGSYQKDCLEIEEYELLCLSLGDSYNTVIDKLGEPNNKNFEVHGNTMITQQRLYTYLYYDDYAIVVQNYLDGESDLDGVIEINVFTKGYATTKGISVGDSVQQVVEAYGIYAEDLENKDKHIGSLIYKRSSAEFRESTKQIVWSDYGDFDSMCYLTWPEPDYVYPTLYFLFYEDKVSRIVLLNTLELHT